MTIMVVLLLAIVAAVAFAARRTPPGYPGYFGYWWFLFPFGFILFLFLVFAAVRVAFWPWGMRRRWMYMDDPVHILRQRYARGEITKEQFDQMLKDLTQSR